jgi:hypothetical protein
MERVRDRKGPNFQANYCTQNKLLEIMDLFNGKDNIETSTINHLKYFARLRKIETEK